MRISTAKVQLVREDIGLLKLVIRKRLGIDLSGYKDGFLRRRVYTRMMACRTSTIHEYIKILESSVEERRRLLDALAINVSRFFRDPAVWKVVIDKVLTNSLRTALDNNRRLHIWSAGCAHGQEPYTIAIIIHELAKRLGGLPPVKIYATDIDQDALRKARQASYTRAEVADVPLSLLREYFDHADGFFKVKEQVKRLVVFKRHDLIKEPPLNFINIIFCRNVIIYFDKPTQYRVFRSFYKSLIPPAYLVLGATEVLTNEASALFKVVDSYARIYRKNTLSLYPSRRTTFKKFI